MKYLKQINPSRSIYEGYQKMNFDWHLCDILICNHWSESYNWNNMYSFYANKNYYTDQFAAIGQKYAAYNDLIRLVTKLKPQWNSPITLYYPLPITNETWGTSTVVDLIDTPSVVAEVKTWVETNYPASNYQNKKIIRIYIQSVNDTSDEIIKWETIQFRNDRGSWVQAEEYYRPRGC